jgi:hypothetical protein
MEHHRKQAKALVRAVRAGDEDALRRAREVLGDRGSRFQLADAQHVVAREQGHRTWTELKRAEDQRQEWDVDRGRRYGEGDPVLVRVKRRPGRWELDDRGAAAERAGRPPGWQEVAHEVVVRDFFLNVDRRGRIFVPTVHERLVEELVDRVAAASEALYLSLLDMAD